MVQLASSGGFPVGGRGGLFFQPVNVHCTRVEWFRRVDIAPGRFVLPGNEILWQKLAERWTLCLDWSAARLYFPSISDYFCSCWIFQSCCDVFLMFIGCLLVERSYASVQFIYLSLFQSFFLSFFWAFKALSDQQSIIIISVTRELVSDFAWLCTVDGAWW